MFCVIRCDYDSSLYFYFLSWEMILVLSFAHTLSMINRLAHDKVTSLEGCMITKMTE